MYSSIQKGATNGTRGLDLLWNIIPSVQILLWLKNGAMVGQTTTAPSRAIDAPPAKTS